jgi:hypothetical protein
MEGMSDVSPKSKKEIFQSYQPRCEKIMGMARAIVILEM